MISTTLSSQSVFLHALAGRIKADKKLTLKGDRFYNGVLQPPDAILPAAFVEQEVNFFPRMTVRETLDFRVALHFGDLLEKDARDELVYDLMKQLGLTPCAETIVGDVKVRGISSGERKRLSIAVEMISSPSLVCCDEPTSSLDSAAATVVIEKLRKLANKGKTVICVIGVLPWCLSNGSYNTDGLDLSRLCNVLGLEDGLGIREIAKNGQHDLDGFLCRMNTAHAILGDSDRLQSCCARGKY